MESRTGLRPGNSTTSGRTSTYRRVFPWSKEKETPESTKKDDAFQKEEQKREMQLTGSINELQGKIRIFTEHMAQLAKLLRDHQQPLQRFFNKELHAAYLQAEKKIQEAEKAEDSWFVNLIGLKVYNKYFEEDEELTLAYENYDKLNSLIINQKRQPKKLIGNEEYKLLIELFEAAAQKQHFEEFLQPVNVSDGEDNRTEIVNAFLNKVNDENFIAWLVAVLRLQKVNHFYWIYIINPNIITKELEGSGKLNYEESEALSKFTINPVQIFPGISLLLKEIAKNSRKQTKLLNDTNLLLKKIKIALGDSNEYVATSVDPLDITDNRRESLRLTKQVKRKLGVSKLTSSAMQEKLNQPTRLSPHKSSQQRDSTKIRRSIARKDEYIKDTSKRISVREPLSFVADEIFYAGEGTMKRRSYYPSRVSKQLFIESEPATTIASGDNPTKSVAQPASFFTRTHAYILIGLAIILLTTAVVVAAAVTYGAALPLLFIVLLAAAPLVMGGGTTSILKLADMFISWAMNKKEIPNSHAKCYQKGVGRGKEERKDKDKIKFSDDTNTPLTDDDITPPTTPPCTKMDKHPSQDSTQQEEKKGHPLPKRIR